MCQMRNKSLRYTDNMLQRNDLLHTWHKIDCRLNRQNVALFSVRSGKVRHSVTRRDNKSFSNKDSTTPVPDAFSTRPAPALWNP
jgi:hypothetical protein